MDELKESEIFCAGLHVGISICQRAIVAAHERKEPLKVGDMLYYLQDGRERLAEVLEEMCK